MHPQYLNTAPSPMMSAANRRGFRSAATALALLLSITIPAVADEPTLDELLDLEPSTPADAEPDADDTTTSPPRGNDAPAGLKVDEDIRQMLRRDEVTDAFQQAVRQMDGVARRLGGDLDPGLATQREQESILAKLEQIIKAAQQQQSSSSQGSGGESSGQQQARQQDAGAQDLAQQGQDGQGSQAQADASNGTGENTGQSSAGEVIEGEQGDGPLEELRREWGQLPPRLRDEISEGLQERFSPTYRSMTEAYYRRLAEEENE